MKKMAGEDMSPLSSRPGTAAGDEEELDGEVSSILAADEASGGGEVGAMGGGKSGGKSGGSKVDGVTDSRLQKRVLAHDRMLADIELQLKEYQGRARKDRELNKILKEELEDALKSSERILTLNLNSNSNPNSNLNPNSNRNLNRNRNRNRDRNRDRNGNRNPNPNPNPNPNCTTLTLTLKSSERL